MRLFLPDHGAREKSELIIDRLVELVCGYEPSSRRDFERVGVVLRGQNDLAAKRIQAYLDRQDDRAELPPVRATELYLKLTGAIPDRIERFSQRGEFYAIVELTYPFQPKSRQEVVQILRKEIAGDADAIDIRAVVVRDSASALILVKGLGPWSRLSTVIDSTAGIKKSQSATITPEMRPGLDAILRNVAEITDIPPSTASYEAPFKELYDQLGREYPNFALEANRLAKSGR